MATDIATTRKDGAIRKELSNRRNTLTSTKGIQRYKKTFARHSVPGKSFFCGTFFGQLALGEAFVEHKEGSLVIADALHRIDEFLGILFLLNLLGHIPLQEDGGG